MINIFTKFSIFDGRTSGRKKKRKRKTELFMQFVQLRIYIGFFLSNTLPDESAFRNFAIMNKRKHRNC